MTLLGSLLCDHRLANAGTNSPQSSAAQPVPMLDLKRQYRPLHYELMQALGSVLEAHPSILATGRRR
ncbi:MAG: hypothetical protein ABR991_10520 [Terracidiphilus sp.]